MNAIRTAIPAAPGNTSHDPVRSEQIAGSQPPRPMSRFEWDRRRDEGAPSAVELITRYLTLKAEISEREEALNALKPQIIDIVTDEPGDKVEGVLGCDLKVTMRTSYRYSPETREAERHLKAIKKREEEDGTAKVERTTAVLSVTAARPPKGSPEG